MHRPVAVAILLAPFALAGIGLAIFAPSCVDGFCPGLIAEAAGSIAALGFVALVAFAVLARRAETFRPIGGSWAAALAVGAAVVAASQVYEGDFSSAMGALLAAAIFVAIVAFAARRAPGFRSPRQPM